MSPSLEKEQLTNEVDEWNWTDFGDCGHVRIFFSPMLSDSACSGTPRSGEYVVGFGFKSVPLGLSCNRHRLNHRRLLFELHPHTFVLDFATRVLGVFTAYGLDHYVLGMVASAVKLAIKRKSNEAGLQQL